MDNVEEKVESIEKKNKENKPEMSLPNLKPGMRVEVAATNNYLIFMGEILEIKEGVVEIEEEFGDNLPNMEPETEVKLRGFCEGVPYTVAGVVAETNWDVWKVGQLRSLQNGEQRQHFRQLTGIEAEMMCVNEIFGRQSGGTSLVAQTMPCHVIDVSGGGMCIRCKESFEQGDWLLVAGVNLLPEGPVFSFTCQIRRRKDMGNEFEYGCQFGAMEDWEQERLIRVILTMQRRELQARRKKR